MLGPLLPPAVHAPTSHGLAAFDPGMSGVVPLISPVVILTLCVVAGLGTVMLLPSRRETPLRKLGGVVVLAAGLILGALLLRATAQRMHVYFWVFSFVALAAAVRVVTHPRPVYSALYFILTVFATAGLFVLLWSEFMAAALVLIYAGAILVTYVFVIMLAAQATAPPTAAELRGDADGGHAGSHAGDRPASLLAEYDTVSREPLVASALGFTLMGVLLFVILDRGAAPAAQPETNAAVRNLVKAQQSTQALGRHLFEYHLVNLELAGLILTVAMVGAIIIARRRVLSGDTAGAVAPEVLTTPATPVDDNPHSIPVTGTLNPRQKEYPET
jgi:NADH-quinone oxidoreductase subunit J